jgi:hypothetical protein
MKELRLSNINLQAPYQVKQNPHASNSYFLAIISRMDNLNLQLVIEEFDETISFLFDPI